VYIYIYIYILVSFMYSLFFLIEINFHVLVIFEVLYKVVLKLNTQLRYYFNKIKYFVKVSLPEILKRVYIDYTKKGVH
jgi:hypothetical protein